jgi:hypothetical protein
MIVASAPIRYVAVAGAALLLAVAVPPHARALDPACVDAIAQAPFTGVDELRTWHQLMAAIGPRPTASLAQRQWLRWLRAQLRRIPGMKLRIDRYPLMPRQLERSATLEAFGSGGARQSIPTAGPIPYAALTGRGGVDAALKYVPAPQPISAAVAAGAIVIRELRPIGVPYSLFEQIASLWHDPRHTLAPDAFYEREHLSHQTLDDIEAAAAAGAAGLVMVQASPRQQIAGQYQPYRGRVWPIPGVFLGADEGRALIELAQAGGTPRARLTTRGGSQRAPTWNLIATLPGAGAEKLVVASHTDGMNPLWDNGPLAMLALARHFAALPVACRPRAIEFAFTTAHLYLSEHGAARYAESLVPACDTVPLVVVLEHLGANEFLAVPRPDGRGRVLAPSGFPELTFVFATPTAAILGAVAASVTQHDLERVAVVPFSTGIANGEGKAYESRGFPTIAAIAAPWTLRMPAFGMETVNVEAMRRWTLASRDMILQLQDLPRATISDGRACRSLPAE